MHAHSRSAQTERCAARWRPYPDRTLLINNYARAAICVVAPSRRHIGPIGIRDVYYLYARRSGSQFAVGARARSMCAFFMGKLYWCVQHQHQHWSAFIGSQARCALQKTRSHTNRSGAAHKTNWSAKWLAWQFVGNLAREFGAVFELTECNATDITIEYVY